MAEYWEELAANCTEALEEEKIAALTLEAVQEGERARIAYGYDHKQSRTTVLSGLDIQEHAPVVTTHFYYGGSSLTILRWMNYSICVRANTCARVSIWLQV